MYQNIMEKWKWGNFDKEQSFIRGPFLYAKLADHAGKHHSPRPSTGGRRQKGESRTALVDKYFEVFPRMNFPYDQFTAFMADIYALSWGKSKGSGQNSGDSRSNGAAVPLSTTRSTPEFKKGYKQDI
jgi:hypothetical protein